MDVRDRDAGLRHGWERQAASLGAYESRVDAGLERLERGGFSSRLHARDASLWSADPSVQKAIKNRLGWLTIAEKMTNVSEQLAVFANEIRDDGFRDIVLLGMGGSSLAPEVLRNTLGVADGYPNLTVADT